MFSFFFFFSFRTGDLISESSDGEEGDHQEADDVEGPAPATVVYVGHLPFGFFEKEMSGFFKQFGKVKNVKVARSSRTARSKGYGWLEFESADVAAIAAKAMHGYMMFKKKLEVRVLTPEQVDAKKLFRNSRRKMLPSRRPLIHKAAVNAPTTEERHAKLVKKQIAKRGRLEKELASLGIEYELPGAAKKAKKVEEVEKKQTTKKGKAETVVVSPKSVVDGSAEKKKKTTTKQQQETTPAKTTPQAAPSSSSDKKKKAGLVKTPTPTKGSASKKK